MTGTGGFEPPTSGLVTRRSLQTKRRAQGVSVLLPGMPRGGTLGALPTRP